MYGGFIGENHIQWLLFGPFCPNTDLKHHGHNGPDTPELFIIASIYVESLEMQK